MTGFADRRIWPKSAEDLILILVTLMMEFTDTRRGIPAGSLVGAAATVCENLQGPFGGSAGL
jgi:hypothetical protein